MCHSHAYRLYGLGSIKFGHFLEFGVEPRFDGLQEKGVCRNSDAHKGFFAGNFRAPWVHPNHATRWLREGAQHEQVEVGGGLGFRA